MTLNQDSTTDKSVQPSSTPNESTGLNIDEHVRITDPNTGAVILEQRA